MTEDCNTCDYGVTGRCFPLLKASNAIFGNCKQRRKRAEIPRKNIGDIVKDRE